MDIVITFRFSANDGVGVASYFTPSRLGLYGLPLVVSKTFISSFASIASGSTWNINRTTEQRTARTEYFTTAQKKNNICGIVT